jgi:hypothetical protein
MGRLRFRGKEESMGSRRTWEKLYRAVHTLTVADAPLKERLGSAFRSNLLELTPQDFAEAALQHDFESLYVDADSGRVLRTDWLSEQECTHAADTILHLFIEVTRKIEQEDFEGWLKNRLLGGT